jgi:hypothetical protein
MAKHCEHCKQPYPDDLKACPHCGRPAEAHEPVEVHPAEEAAEEALLVDEGPQAEGEAILVDEHGHRPLTEEAIDLPDVHVLNQRPGSTSDVALGHQPPSGEGTSDVALVHEVPPGEGESDVALASRSDINLGGAGPEPARGADSAVRLPRPVAPTTGQPPAPPAAEPPPSGTSDVAWAALVEDEEPPAETAGVSVDAPSDAHLLREVHPAEEVPAAAEAEEALPVVEADEEPVEAVAEPVEEEAEAIVVPEEGGSDLNLGPRGETPSAVDLTGMEQGPTLPGSDLNFVPEAMDSGTSNLSLGGAGARAPAEAGSGIDAVPEGSGIDVSPAPARKGSGSDSDLDLGTEGGGSSLDLSRPGEPGGSDSGLQARDPWAQPGEEGWPGEAAPPSAADLGETVAYDEGPPSARDIVEEVESGVDLSAPAQGEAAVGAAKVPSGSDSAIDLGAQAETTDPAAGVLGSDRLMEEMRAEGEAQAAAARAEEVPEEVEEERAPAAVGEPQPSRARAVLPWVGGWLAGVGMTAAAVWLLGMIFPPRAVTPPGVPRQAAAPAPEAPSLESAQTRLRGGDYQEALKMYQELGQGAAENPSFLAQRGEAEWLNALQQLGGQGKPITKQELANVAEVAKAQEDLKKAADANNPDGLFWLGQVQEVMDGPDAARKTFQKGLEQFKEMPDQRQRFQAALDILDVSAPAAGEAGARLLPPSGSEAYWRALALVALQGPPFGAPQGAAQLPPGAPPGAAPTVPQDEAGYYFWQAVRSAQQNKYPDAIKALDEARRVHERHRYSRKIQNPLTDPTQQIFLRATDELRAYWKVREKLASAGVLEQIGRPSSEKVLAALDRLAADQKVVTEVTAHLKEEKYDTTNLPRAVEQFFQDRAKAAADRQGGGKASAELLAALKAAGVRTEDPVQGVKDLDKARKADEKRLDEVLAALKAAGVNADDPVRGVEDLEKRRKDEEKKLADVAAALKAAGAKADDPAEGVKQVVAAREEADATLNGVRKELVERKYLPATAKARDIPEGVKRLLGDVDHPVVAALGGLANELGGMGGKVGDGLVQGIGSRAALVAARLELAKMRAQVGEAWTPEQMMDVWLVLLRDPADRGLAARALRDVRAVLNEKPMPAAVCVKALAERDEGQIDAARADLKSIDGASGEPNAPWRQVVRTTLAELTDPSAYYVPRVQEFGAAKRWGAALAAADEALKVFPQQDFAKEHASLLALRSQVLLELARAQGGDALPPDLVARSQQDAAAAVQGGDTVEGKYAQGRLAEAQADLARAEGLYRDAVKAFDAANPADFRKAHPASDPSGSRYREALTRVLLEEVGRSRPVPAEATPAEGTKTGRAGGAGSSTRATGNTTTVTRSAGVVLSRGPAGCGACVLPFVALQQPAGEEAAATDARLQEALGLADKLIAAGDTRGYFLKGETLGRMGRWNEARRTVTVGVRRLLPPDEAAHVNFLLENHPAFQRREGLRSPDLMLAEEHYAEGLREYFDAQYAAAEKDFSDAVYYNDRDARYVYFLGLARLPQPGKQDLATDDFRRAARLEAEGKPPSAAVSLALERVQGPARHLLNRVRDDAIREFTSKQP